MHASMHACKSEVLNVSLAKFCLMRPHAQYEVTALPCLDSTDQSSCCSRDGKPANRIPGCPQAHPPDSSIDTASCMTKQTSPYQAANASAFVAGGCHKGQQCKQCACPTCCKHMLLLVSTLLPQPPSRSQASQIAQLGSQCHSEDPHRA